jgi:preprotein translocase subunit Sec61beta
MSKMKLKPRTRILVTMAIFVGVVIALAILYSLVGASLGGQSPNKWMLALFGPVLALPTHMSIFLFLPLCVPLIVLLCTGALYPQARTIVAIGFIVTWLVMGWYLRILF